MAEKIKQYILSLRFSYPRSIFDMSPGELHYESPDYRYPSTEEAWKGDWENVGRAFRSAAGCLLKESVA